MDPITKLRSEAEASLAKAKEIHDKGEAEHRDLTDEEQKEFDRLMAEAKAKSDEADRLEQAQTNRQQRGAQLSGLDRHFSQSPGRQTNPGQPTQRPRVEVSEPNAQADHWLGFRNAADFAVAVQRACIPGGRLDPRFTNDRYAAPTNFHETSGTDGYMVPPAMRDQIWELVFSDVDYLSSVDSEPTDSNSVQLIADETTPWGSTGVQAYWRSEGAQMTASRLATKGRTVNLDELYAFVLATDELLMDASRLNSRLTVQAARAIRWKANDAIVYGTGAGQPLGFFSSAVLVSVAKEGSQAADTIVAANVLKMFSRLLTAGLQNVFWTVNPDVLPQLGVMTIGDQPIWTPPSSGLREAPGGFLLGRPVRFSEHNKTLGDKGDIFLIDPMGYYLTMKRGGVQSASSIHLYFDYNITAFRWTFRLGGQPHLSAPISPANGSATKSHFVTLDERA